uniref:Uncharacterized protein n=1 Tax=Sphaerodactylus townsendi TaxID=933632 RepID=A0ACB8E9H6_9SAUR
MAEAGGLEAASEHERILREVDSTDTACIGPTLRCGSLGARALPRVGLGACLSPKMEEGPFTSSSFLFQGVN